MASDANFRPEGLVENELFGHRAGAFTGANTDRTGLVEQANGGSLFLDEVDCLTKPVQVKLLRLLQESCFRPLGAARETAADIRVIAATNADLKRAVDLGRFRKDLYYRLKGASFQLPPLRSRGDDIARLARYFLKVYAIKSGRAIHGFAPGVLPLLTAHAWPGNVRELQNVMESAVAQAQGAFIRMEDIDLGFPDPPTRQGSYRRMKAEASSAWATGYFTDVLQTNGDNISAAARVAGMDRRSFRRHLEKLNLTRSSAQLIANFVLFLPDVLALV